MSSPVLYLVGCAAPPIRAIGELIPLLRRLGWDVCVIATPTAANWIDGRALLEQTGYPVHGTARHPDNPASLPKADAILVVPATFNTINKWAGGISDNFALGLLNEAIGLELPTVVVPYAKQTLAAHPAFGESLTKLASWGVTVLPNELIRPPSKEQPFLWQRLVGALARQL
jgi:phosphopantothenoylcysteine decarboxylase